MGEQELFHDSFSGASGFYIYEEMPCFGQKKQALPVEELRVYLTPS